MGDQSIDTRTQHLVSAAKYGCGLLLHLNFPLYSFTDLSNALDGLLPKSLDRYYKFRDGYMNLEDYCGLYLECRGEKKRSAKELCEDISNENNIIDKHVKVLIIVVGGGGGISRTGVFNGAVLLYIPFIKSMKFVDKWTILDELVFGRVFFVTDDTIMCISSHHSWNTLSKTIERSEKKESFAIGSGTNIFTVPVDVKSAQKNCFEYSRNGNNTSDYIRCIEWISPNLFISSGDRGYIRIWKVGKNIPLKEFHIDMKTSRLVPHFYEDESNLCDKKVEGIEHMKYVDSYIFLLSKKKILIYEMNFKDDFKMSLFQEIEITSIIRDHFLSNRLERDDLRPKFILLGKRVSFGHMLIIVNNVSQNKSITIHLIKAYSSSIGKTRHEWKVHKQYEHKNKLITACDISDNGIYAIFGHNDGSLYVYMLNQYSLIQKVKKHMGMSFTEIAPYFQLRKSKKIHEFVLSYVRCKHIAFPLSSKMLIISCSLDSKIFITHLSKERNLNFFGIT